MPSRVQLQEGDDRRSQQSRRDDYSILSVDDVEKYKRKINKTLKKKFNTFQQFQQFITQLKKKNPKSSPIKTKKI